MDISVLTLQILCNLLHMSVLNGATLLLILRMWAVGSVLSHHSALRMRVVSYATIRSPSMRLQILWSDNFAEYDQIPHLQNLGKREE